MKNIKFYVWALLIGAMSLSFNACNDDDENGSISDEMKGGNIVGTWTYNESQSKNTINGQNADEYLSQLIPSKEGENASNEAADELDDEDFNPFEMLDADKINDLKVLAKDTLIFNEDGKFYASDDASGTYETDGNELSLTYTAEDGTVVTVKSGADFTKLIQEKAKLPEGGVSLEITSVQYSVVGKTLAIKAFMVATYDLSVILPEDMLQKIAENGMSVGKTTLNIESISVFNLVE